MNKVSYNYHDRHSVLTANSVGIIKYSACSQCWKQIQWINYPTRQDDLSHKHLLVTSGESKQAQLYIVYIILKSSWTEFLKRKVQFKIWSIEDQLIYGGGEFPCEIYFDWIHCDRQFVLICSDCERSYWRVQDLVNGQCWDTCLASTTYLLHHISLLPGMAEIIWWGITNTISLHRSVTGDSFCNFCDVL